ESCVRREHQFPHIRAGSAVARRRHDADADRPHASAPAKSQGREPPMSPRIVVVNYLMGNLGSISNMLHRIGYASVVSSDAGEISRADKLILPGVGHFDRGMEQLAALGLIDVMARKVLEDKTPVLGICLGMQLLGARSEEGARRG